MASFTEDARQAFFDEIQNNADRILFLSGTEPTDYTEATGSIEAEIAVSSADFSAADTTDGKELQPSEKGAVAASSNSADWIAIVDDDNNTLLQVNSADGTALQADLAYNVSGQNLEIQDA